MDSRKFFWLHVVQITMLFAIFLLVIDGRMRDDDRHLTSDPLETTATTNNRDSTTTNSPAKSVSRSEARNSSVPVASPRSPPEREVAPRGSPQVDVERRESAPVTPSQTTTAASTSAKITSDFCLNSDSSKITDPKTAETCYQLVCEPDVAPGNEGRCIRFMARSAGIQDF